MKGEGPRSNRLYDVESTSKSQSLSLNPILLTLWQFSYKVSPIPSSFILDQLGSEMLGNWPAKSTWPVGTHMSLHLAPQTKQTNV